MILRNFNFSPKLFDDFSVRFSFDVSFVSHLSCVNKLNRTTSSAVGTKKNKMPVSHRIDINIGSMYGVIVVTIFTVNYRRQK